MKPKIVIYRTQSKPDNRKRIQRNNTKLRSTTKRRETSFEIIKTPKQGITHHKTTALALKKITEDIFSIGNDIEKITKPRPRFQTNNQRKSITPPAIPGYRITKQSFPNIEIKFQIF